MTTARRRALLPALATLALLACGCGRAPERGSNAVAGERPGWVEHRDARRGYSVSFPPSWRRADEAVAPSLTDPREVFSVGTFRTRYQPTNCEAFAGAARSDMERHDVFLTVQERGYDRGSEWRDFPPRPATFGPTEGEPAEEACGDPPGTTIHWRNFGDAGRYFHTLVAIGPDAPAAARKEVWSILDSLELDPGRKPGWQSSG